MNMLYALKTTPGVMAVTLLAVISLQTFTHDKKPDRQTVGPGQTQHGLRAYLDPSTGEYGRPPESPSHLQPALSAQASLPLLSGQPRPSEIRSNKAGGGFSIDMRERFRPSRQTNLSGS